MFDLGDIVCWLPYGPYDGPPPGTRVTLPPFVVGEVTRICLIGNRVIGMKDQDGTEWDPSCRPTWLFADSRRPSLYKAFKGPAQPRAFLETTEFNRSG